MIAVRQNFQKDPIYITDHRKNRSKKCDLEGEAENWG